MNKLVDFWKLTKLKGEFSSPPVSPIFLYLLELTELLLDFLLKSKMSLLNLLPFLFPFFYYYELKI